MGASVVLATNDDGIGAPGLHALVSALASTGLRVYVVAPKGPASSTGKSLRYPARYGRASVEGAIAAWWVDSTPASAVVAGLKYLLPEPPSLVVSGVNRGPNMGLEDFLTSGTIGAAVEAALHGVVGIAVSLATDRGREAGEYVRAARIAADLARAALSIPPPGRGCLLVVNVPEDEPLGVKITSLAWNNYRTRITLSEDGLAPEPHSYRDRYWDLEPGTDVYAVMNGYVALTPVCLDALRSTPSGAWEWASRLASTLGLD